MTGRVVDFERTDSNSFRLSVTNRIGMILFRDWLSFRGVSSGFVLPELDAGRSWTRCIFLPSSTALCCLVGGRSGYPIRAQGFSSIVSQRIAFAPIRFCIKFIAFFLNRAAPCRITCCYFGRSSANQTSFISDANAGTKYYR